MLRYLLIAVFSLICGLIPFAAPSYAADDKITAKDWINLGLAAIEQQKYYAATSSFTNALELEPKNAETYYNRALAYAYQGEFDKAIADVNDAIKYSPEKDKGSYYTSRGLLYQTKGMKQEAVADYKKALTYQLADNDKKLCQERLAQLNSDNSSTTTTTGNKQKYTDKAQDSYKSGHYQEAIQYSTKAIDNGESMGYLIRAMAYRTTENYPNAINDYTTFMNTLSDDETISVVLAERGLAYINYALSKDVSADKTTELGKMGIDDYKAALKKDNTNIQAGYRLADLFATYKEYKAAKIVLDDLIANNPKAADNSDVQELQKDINKNL